MDSSDQLIERLTRREIDILTLLAEHLTDREIAERLVLSLQTVKWYARQIFSKLGAGNRREAVRVAQQLGLLAPLPAKKSPTSPASKKHTHNLPRQLSSFIGRENEINQVVKMVWAHPLVTLTGAGGVGKTRLALVVAAELVDDFADGVWYVELASLSDPLLVAQTVANAIGIQRSPDQSAMDALRSFFYDRQAMLVLDNCEHLVQACAELVQALLTALPRLIVVNTSRVPLGLNGEAIFRVPSLSFPAASRSAAGLDLLEFEAVRLFVERVFAISPGFELNAANAALVAHICRRLDGIPLAIELAAARARMLSIEQIAGRLDHTFQLLTSDRHSALPRHQTITALIGWSYNMLSPIEQLLLRRLAVFSGGWTLEAAEQVCSDIDSGSGAVELGCPALALQKDRMIDLLGRLIDQSLIQFEPGQDGEPRYNILETVRQFSAQRLAESSEQECVRMRHLDFYLALCLQAEPYLRSHQSKPWLERLNRELDNLRLALQCALDGPVEKGLRLATSLLWFYWSRSHGVEGAAWLERLLNAQEHQAAGSLSVEARVARGRALHALFLMICLHTSALTMRLVEIRDTFARECYAIFSDLRDAYPKDFARARQINAKTLHDFLECRALLKMVDDPFWQAEIDGNLVACYPPESDEAIFYAEENLALRIQIGDLDGQGEALHTVGYLELCRGNEERSVAITLEALACFEKAGNLVNVGYTQSGFLSYYTSRGDYAKARQYGEALLEAVHALNHEALRYNYLTYRAWLAIEENEFDLAVDLCEQSLELRRALPVRNKSFPLDLLCQMALARGNLPKAKAYLKQVCSPEVLQSGWYNGHRAIQLMGVVAAYEGQMGQAALWFGAQDGIYEHQRWLVKDQTRYDRQLYQQAVAAARAALGEEAFKAAWEEGRAMNMAQVIEKIR